MFYKKIIPIKALQDYIRYFWILEDFKNNSSDKCFKIIPDGLPALIFQQEPNLFFDKKGHALPQLYLYGQYSKYTEHTVSGYFSVIGVYLQPTALKTIFGLDAFELNHQNISLEDIVRDAILEQLVNAISLEEKISLISSFFLKQIERVKNNHKKLVHASTLLQNGKTLKEIQLGMNLSERTLERIIKQSVGLSPKIFSRIMRFQDGLNCLRQTNFENFTELAYQYDYF
ncbi:MAG: AraC family transcriptional regulator, partial [Dysgonomonas mossii]|nr:AraC family transcriptional regulator [Dysgonomonas mossii]